MNVNASALSGMTALSIGKGVTLGVYQATKIRHFHNMWDNWIYGDKKPTS